MSRERYYNPANQEQIIKREQPAYLNETFDKRTKDGKIAERTQALMRAIYESNTPTQTLIPLSEISDQLRQFISHSASASDISVSIEEIFDVALDESGNIPHSIRIIVWDTSVSEKHMSANKILDLYEYFFHTPAQIKFMMQRQPKEQPEELMDKEIQKMELRELLASATPLLKITEETKQRHLTTMIHDVLSLQLPSFDTAVLFTISVTSKSKDSPTYQLRIWDAVRKTLLHSITLSI